MASRDNEKLIKLVKVHLICAGAWQRPFTNPKTDFIYKMYSKFMRVTFVVVSVLIWTEFLRLIFQKYEQELIMSNLVVITNNTKIGIKVAIYWKNKVLDFFNDVIDKERQVWENGDSEIVEFYAKKIRVCEKFILAQAVPTFIAIVALQITGVYGNTKLIDYNKSNNGTLETHFGYPFWFPANKLEHLWLTYFIQLIFCWSLNNYYCFVNGTASVLLISGAVHLEILQIRVRKFISEVDDNLRMDQKTSELKSLIADHQYLIRFCQHLNKSIRNIIFVEYLLNSVDVASCVVTLIKVQTVGEFAKQLIFILLLCVQTFILAWTANEVKLQSERVADAAFESHWYLLDKNGGYLIAFMIARAQKPLVMNIGPFGAMTTQSAILIMRAAYSYVSIMKQ